jgi:hypothetical protein
MKNQAAIDAQQRTLPVEGKISKSRRKLNCRAWLRQLQCGVAAFGTKAGKA